MALLVVWLVGSSFVCSAFGDVGRRVKADDFESFIFFLVNDVVQHAFRNED